MQKKEFLKQIGLKLSLFRKKSGLSQFELAEKSGKMINTISNIERGLADPRLSTLLSLTNVLEISLTDLLSENETIVPNDTTKIILKKIQACDEKSLKYILKQLDLTVELLEKKQNHH